MKITFLFLLFIHCCAGSAQEANKSELNNISALKLSTMIYGFNYEFTINPSYSQIKNSHEMNFGLYYQKVNVNYLIRFKRYYSKVYTYGLKCGYISKPKWDKKVSLNMEVDVILSLIYSKINVNGEIEASSPVLSFSAYYGPNLGIRISKYVRLYAVIQLGLGYGTNSTVLGANAYGSGFYDDYETLIGILYRLHKK